MDTIVADSPRAAREPDAVTAQPAAPERVGSPLPPPPARSRRWLRGLVFLGVLATAGSFVAWRYEHTAAEAPAVLVLEGNVDVRQVNLAFKVAGRIESLAVDEGDPVKAGQVIATLDSRYFDDDLRLMRGQRDQAVANLEKLLNGSRPEEIDQARALEDQLRATLRTAEEDSRRAEQLRSGGGISGEEADHRKMTILEARARLASAVAARKLTEIGPRQEEIAAARALVEQMEAQILMSERRMQDSRLLAPNDGVILTRAREKGAIVNAGEVVFTLTLASPVWVRTYVGEPDLGAVRPNLEVAVRSDATTGRTWNGRIGFISPTAEFTPKTVETRELRTDLVYRLRIVIDDPDAGLRQGMPVTTTIALPGGRPRTFKERLGEALGLDRLSRALSGGR